MELRLFVVSETTLIDQRTNNVSVLNILEQLKSSAFPVFVQRLSVLAIFERQPEEPEIVDDVSISTSVGDQVVFSAQVPLNFQGRPRIRTVTDINGVIIPSPGIFLLSVKRGTDTLGTWKILVTQVGGPTAEVSATPASPPPPVPSPPTNQP